MAQVLITLAFLLPFVLTGASPMTDLLPAIAGHNALNMITKMDSTSASTIVATSQGKLTGSKYSTIYAPLLAIIGFIATGVLIVLHYKDITGTDALWVNAMPLMIVTCALYGALKQWQIDRDVFVQRPCIVRLDCNIETLCAHQNDQHRSPPFANSAELPSASGIRCDWKPLSGVITGQSVRGVTEARMCARNR
ncbi:hypothetical protein [Rhodococcus opacus]|nr:hypothetical protein [Rhodococcus opacus]